MTNAPPTEEETKQAEEIHAIVQRMLKQIPHGTPALIVGGVATTFAASVYVILGIPIAVLIEGLQNLEKDEAGTRAYALGLLDAIADEAPSSTEAGSFASPHG